MAHGALNLLLDGETGFWHMAHPESVTWAEVAELAVRALGAMMPGPEADGEDSRNFALATEQGVAMPPVEEALTRWAFALEAGTSADRAFFLM